jgi:hypothetical protein
MNAGTLSLARQFIDENYWEYRHSAGFYHGTNVMKGRTVPPADLVRFINGLSLAPPKGNNPRIIIVPHYPRIWDEWAREKDQVDVERLYAAESDTDVSEDAKKLAAILRQELASGAAREAARRIEQHEVAPPQPPAAEALFVFARTADDVPTATIRRARRARVRRISRTLRRLLNMVTNETDTRTIAQFHHTRSEGAA